MSIHSGEDVGAFVSGFPPVLIMGLIIRHHLHEVLFSNLIYHLINYCKVVTGVSTYIGRINELTKNCCFIEV